MAIAYDSDHYLVTFGGNLVGGHETWQCGLRFAAAAGEVPTVPEWELALNDISASDIYTAVRALWIGATAGARWDTKSTIEFAKVAVISITGHYLIDPKEHRATTTGTLNATNTIPPQLAVAVSFRSGTKIGRANHGRIYLPAPTDWATGVDSTTGKLPTAYVDALRAATKTMIEAVAGEVSTVGISTDFAIFSPRTPSSVGTWLPSHKKVQDLGIGAVVDTQRSRRRNLPDTIVTWSPISS